MVMSALRVHRRLQRISGTVVLLVGLGAPRLARADLKLYLRDGSFQLVKSYEVRGQRVRYYSVERSQWEEIPVSLVDFEATRRAEQQSKSEQQKQLEQARELEKERFDSIPANTGFAIAPGVRLPASDGVYADDGGRVVSLIQSAGQIVTDKKRRALTIALPAPLLKNRSLVVLDGAQAAVRLLYPQPTFYIQSADNWGAKAELVPVKSTKDSRIVEKIQGGLGFGRPGEVRQAIPTERQQVAPGLYRLRPTQPLRPGEYAIAETTQNRLNLDVWDFGIEGPSRNKAPAPTNRPGSMSERPPLPSSQPQTSAPLPRGSRPGPYPPPANPP